MTEGGTRTVTIAKNNIRKDKNVVLWYRRIFHPSLQGQMIFLTLDNRRNVLLIDENQSIGPYCVQRTGTEGLSSSRHTVSVTHPHSSQTTVVTQTWLPPETLFNSPKVSSRILQSPYVGLTPVTPDKSPLLG
jgi:hypothetical protein